MLPVTEVVVLVTSARSPKVLDANRDKAVSLSTAAPPPLLLPDKMLYGISALDNPWRPIPKKNEQPLFYFKSVKVLAWFLFA